MLKRLPRHQHVSFLGHNRHFKKTEGPKGMELVSFCVLVIIFSFLFSAIFDHHINWHYLYFIEMAGSECPFGS